MYILRNFESVNIFNETEIRRELFVKWENYTDRSVQKFSKFVCHKGHVKFDVFG